jgi:hypothetical protein
MRALRALLIPVAVALVAGCDSGPQAGDLTMHLVSPVEDLGALSFRITAAEPTTIDTVTAACAGCSVFATRISASEMRGVVTGDVGPGAVLRISVTDTKVPQAYLGQVLEASAPDYELVSSTGMQLTIP